MGEVSRATGSVRQFRAVAVGAKGKLVRCEVGDPLIQESAPNLRAALERRRGNVRAEHGIRHGLEFRELDLEFRKRHGRSLGDFDFEALGQSLQPPFYASCLVLHSLAEHAAKPLRSHEIRTQVFAEHSLSKGAGLLSGFDPKL